MSGKGTFSNESLTLNKGNGPISIDMSNTSLKMTSSYMTSPNTQLMMSFIQDEALKGQIVINDDGENSLIYRTINGSSYLNNSKFDLVKSVSGSVSDGKLTITVNGISSGDIPLPESEPIYICDETQSLYITVNKSAVVDSEVTILVKTKTSIKDVYGINNIVFGNAFYVGGTGIYVYEESDTTENQPYVIKEGSYTITSSVNPLFKDYNKNTITKYKLKNVYVVVNTISSTLNKNGVITDVTIDDENKIVTFVDDIPCNPGQSTGQNRYVIMMVTENTTLEEIS